MEKNNNIKELIRRAQALALAGTLVLTTAGCGKKSNEDGYYSESQLKNTYLATVDGEMTVVKKEDATDVFEYVTENHIGGLYIRGYGDKEGTIVPNCKLYADAFNDSSEYYHEHYFDLLTGANYTDSEDCTAVRTLLSGNADNFQTADVDLITHITSMMTPEEIREGQQGNLTEEDMAKIVIRIFSDEREMKDEASNNSFK